MRSKVALVQLKMRGEKAVADHAITTSAPVAAETRKR